MAIAATRPLVGVWDTVLEFGEYQHATVDGKPVDTIFDATNVQSMLDDFEQHPESDVFYDKQHEILDQVLVGNDETLGAHRAKLSEWAEGDGHAMAWASALAMVVGGQTVRYVAHPDGPAKPPTLAEIEACIHKRPPDGVYCYRSVVTPRGADPSEGMSAFRYTSPYVVKLRDGYRLLNLTATNDPRMRGAALAYEQRLGQRYAMQRLTARSGSTENSMNELMARAGCAETDTPEQKLEKLAAYAAKMEEEGKAKDGDLSGLKAKFEEGEKERTELRRKMEAEKPEAEKKEEQALQALQRAASSAADQATRKVLQGLGLPADPELAKAKLEGLFSLQGEVIEERKRLTLERAASKDSESKRWAKQAVAMGRWKSDQRGTVDDTLAFLEGAYKRDPIEAEKALYEEGTFQVSERVVMERLTQGGAGIGAPEPRTAKDDPDALMDREIARIQKEDPKADFTLAMSRVKKENPKLHQRYQAFIAEGGLARRN